MRSFVRVYEEFSDSSAYEHVNPNIIKRTFIEDEADGKFWVCIQYMDSEQTVASYPFEDVKAAQRFINRVGGIV